MATIDLRQAVLAALQAAPIDSAGRAAPYDHSQAYQLRGKILGLLLRQSRLAAERSPEDCAAFLQVKPELIEAWELGEATPSLPQLELLAGFLQTSDFSDFQTGTIAGQRNEYLLLRQRLIGGRLRAARAAAQQSIADLSAKTALPAALLDQYELGQRMIPVSHLAALAQAVETDLKHFMEAKGPLETANATPAVEESLPDSLEADLSQVAAAEEGLPASLEADLSQVAAAEEQAALIRLALAFRRLQSEDLQSLAAALDALIRARAESKGFATPS